MSNIQVNDFSKMTAALFEAVTQINVEVEAAHERINKQNEIIRDQAIKIFELEQRLKTKDKQIIEIEASVINIAAHLRCHGEFAEILSQNLLSKETRDTINEKYPELVQKRDAGLVQLAQLQQAYLQPQTYSGMQTSTSALPYDYSSSSSAHSPSSTSTSTLTYEHTEAGVTSETNTSDNQDAENEYYANLLASKSDIVKNFLDEQSSKKSEQKTSEVSSEEAANQNPAVTIHTVNDQDQAVNAI